MEIKDFIGHHYKHFNAGVLATCCESLRDFLENDGRMIITLAGAMSTAEIGRSLAQAIRSQKIHAICCTGANLEEDIIPRMKDIVIDTILSAKNMLNPNNR